LKVEAEPRLEFFLFWKAIKDFLKIHRNNIFLFLKFYF
jgi:hypothetical protein